MITVQVGDITKLGVDAIVNAANTGLRGGGGVDGAIHRAAGPELKQACRELGGCPTGDARVTPGFELPARWIIHAVGPVWSGGDRDEPKLLESCYRRSMELALEKGARRIAFPAISTGVYGFPKRQAARIALGVMREYEDRFEEIVACCFGEDDAAVYREILTGGG
ncbi:MAG: O-acetyl-ADP-ribose deacetylase [Gammaproteobacteria bacterium]|nr:O-acetyl-ADP-ribose deacetylase [Gammaproteobacteria bacterium]NIR82277.1 O-acetyl-ADP-ribose deacetylase [Gammaproteobacteria bacterium]NIR91208.1 O-acetyl-ADP-ribose deacetylase [Gammaproteobacteria bacterium]NIU03426.1 O-acetyl-ADP-ribose deacetylase [Gammaproteobacteria bacterium]NIX84701.1 O-acetyl-ADP-ribose deacetylase [Gammaproteobacteria bacterium]